MRQANERWRYIVASPLISLIGRVHTQNDPCNSVELLPVMCPIVFVSNLSDALFLKKMKIKKML